MPESDAALPVAVAIPCYNEAPALEAVLDEWRLALPEAERIVFDNNSTDGSGAIAERLGVRVVPVPGQGKGHVVRAMFKLLRDRPAVVMIDGDGTYPADAVGPLLDSVLAGHADMAVGVRRPIAGAGAMSPVRGLGNLLIRAAFRILIGPGHPDLLTGYRVFGPKLLTTFTPRSSGFEIETELGCETVARGLRIVAVDTAYRPRFAGTQSKLRAVHDGLRIVRVMAREGCRLRPWRAGVLVVAILALGAMAAYGLAEWLG